MLPVPSITRQREIVSEYETLTNRIRLNNQMIQHLEATAQALYRKTFVDNIDKENLPEGWRTGTLGEIADIKNGKAIVPVEGDIPIYGGVMVSLDIRTALTQKMSLLLAESVSIVALCIFIKANAM